MFPVRSGSRADTASPLNRKTSENRPHGAWKPADPFIGGYAVLPAPIMEQRHTARASPAAEIKLLQRYQGA
jgi:hypothetical protein